MLLWRLGSRRGDERKRVALIDYISEGRYTFKFVNITGMKYAEN